MRVMIAASIVAFGLTSTAHANLRYYIDQDVLRKNDAPTLLHRAMLDARPIECGLEAPIDRGWEQFPHDADVGLRGAEWPWHALQLAGSMGSDLGERWQWRKVLARSHDLVDQQLTFVIVILDRQRIACHAAVAQVFMHYTHIHYII